MAVITSKVVQVPSLGAATITITGSGRYVSSSQNQLNAFVTINGVAYESGTQTVDVAVGDDITLSVYGINNYDWGKGRIYIDGVEVLSGSGTYLEYTYTVTGNATIELYAPNDYYGQITVTTS